MLPKEIFNLSDGKEVIKSRRTMMIEEKKYSAEVWDVVYYLVDEDGKPKEDKDGKVELYSNPNEDASYISDHIDIDQLENQ